jgi:hypothetical protein
VVLTLGRGTRGRLLVGRGEHSVFRRRHFFGRPCLQKFVLEQPASRTRTSMYGHIWG